MEGKAKGHGERVGESFSGQQPGAKGGNKTLVAPQEPQARYQGHGQQVSLPTVFNPLPTNDATCMCIMRTPLLSTSPHPSLVYGQ